MGRDIEAVFNVLKHASHCADARNSIIAAVKEHVAHKLDQRTVGTLKHACAVTIIETVEENHSPEANELLVVLRPWLETTSDDVAQSCLKRLVANELPAEWAVHWDGAASRSFYHHPAQGSQWTWPEDKERLPSGWSAYATPEGRAYYHHPELGTQWERPGAVS